MKNSSLSGISKTKLYLFTLFIITIFIYSCSKESSEKSGASIADTFSSEISEITIGTFNLEWLGDGINDRKDRTEEDYENFASIIQSLDADLIGVQEIENLVALNRIIKYLPDYSYYLGKEGGAQKIGLIFKKKLKITFLQEYLPLMITPRKTRPGVLFKAKINNFDFLLMVVHLKSSSHWDNTPEKIENSFGTRELQAEVLSNWADSVQNKKIEEDIIIVGDFNDTPRRKKNNTLYHLNDFKFLTENLRSCRFKNAYVIDHIITSKSAAERVIPQSEFMMDLSSVFSKEEVKQLSDHCPVIVKFDTKKADNDPPRRTAKK